MTIADFLMEECTLWSRLRTKAREFLTKNNLDNLQDIVQISESLSSPRAKKYNLCDLDMSYPGMRYFQFSFCDGYLAGISFLVDDHTDEIIGYLVIK